MSNEVKRYDPINSDGTCGMCIEDADYGAYVEYADYAALEAELAKLRAELERLAVPDGMMLLTDDQLERHATTAWECPPQSRVVLVSSLKRLASKNAAPSAPKADDPVKVWADMLYVTHRPLIRNAVSLLRMRRPVPPDVESVASGLDEMIAGMPTPASEPRSAWMEVAALTEPAHEPVNKRLLEALEDVLWCIDTGPSCQIGVSNRCKCSMCVTGRIRAAIAAARQEGKV